MSKPYIPSLTYMRGLCMLGVIGIHVGSYALSNPQANVHLIAVLEILSRFCVPAFFFLSSFGLFLGTPLSADFHYKEFLKKRLSVVLIPYITWSLIYLTYTAIVSRNLMVFVYSPPAFLFGNTAYHLYFMIILLWFYLLMPLWRKLTALVLQKPLLWLSMLFLLQSAFNFWSSYYGSRIKFDWYWFQYAYDMRLNYWVAHYIWIFLLGAVCAERYEEVRSKLHDYRLLLTAAFTLSVTAMLGSYYYVLQEWHYTLLEAIYTIHQLSPMGMLYTAMGALFFFYFFEVTPFSPGLATFWRELGNASYGIYLSHPLLLFLVTPLLEKAGILLTAKVVIALYLTAVGGAFLLTQLILQEKVPPRAKLLLLGTKQ